jgi:nitroreductase
MLLLVNAIDEGLGAGLLELSPAQRAGRLREELGFPTDVKLLCVLTLGHSAPDPIRQRVRDDLRRRRRPLKDVVSWEHWNRAA